MAPTRLALKKCHDQCEPQEYLLFPCPHCGGEIQVKKTEINCAIFRHAVFKDTWEPIEPHSGKQTVDNLIRLGQIRGCGQPLRLISHEGSCKAVKCDWI